MATSYVQVIDRWFDQYGSILSGGLIETFEAGTSTPLATYQDLDGVVPNTNPVVLDAAGSADIRLTNGVAYKLVLKNSAGVTLDEADDVIIGSLDGASGEEYEVAVGVAGTPGAQAYIHGRTFVRSVNFPANFEGAQGNIQTNPGAQYDIDAQKNGVSVGTISISTSSVFSFSTASGAAFSVVAGDELSFLAPDSGSASDFSFTIYGDVA